MTHQQQTEKPSDIEELRQHLAMALRYIEVLEAYRELGATTPRQIEERIIRQRQLNISSATIGHHPGWDLAYLDFARVRELVKGVPLPERIEELRQRAINHD